MNRLIILLLFAVAALARAALDPLEEAHEATLGQVTLPAHPASQVVIRTDPGADPVVIPVTGETRYFVEPEVERPVPLTRLRQAAAAHPDALVFVFYAVDGNAVTRIVLSPGP